MKVSVTDVKTWLREAPRLVLIGLAAVAVIAGIVVLVIVAVPNTDHGTVLKRAYHAPWDEWYDPPDICTNNYDSKGTYTGQTCIATSPYWVHHDATWNLRVRDEKDEEEWVGVSETVYQGCIENMWYPGKGVACTQGPS